MDMSKLKNLVKQNGDKFIFVENGEPEMVVMSFVEYKKLTGQPHSPGHVLAGLAQGSPQAFSPDEDDEEEVVKGFPPVVVRESIGLPIRLEDIQLEDLPL